MKSAHYFYITILNKYSCRCFNDTQYNVLKCSHWHMQWWNWCYWKSLLCAGIFYWSLKEKHEVLQMWIIGWVFWRNVCKLQNAGKRRRSRKWPLLTFCLPSETFCQVLNNSLCWEWGVQCSSVCCGMAHPSLLCPPASSLLFEVYVGIWL